MDGSPARTAPVELEGVVLPTVLTSVETTEIGEARKSTELVACLAESRDDRAHGPIVVRVGADGESVTFGTSSGHGLWGCDNTIGPRESGRRWCGIAFGRVSGGHLRDPRLGVGCTTAEGRRVGFAWVQPSPRTRFVAVRQPGYAEVYEVDDELPIRVTTRVVDTRSSSAAFELSEHTPDGRLLRRRSLEAAVAG